MYDHKDHYFNLNIKEPLAVFSSPCLEEVFSVKEIFETASLQEYVQHHFERV